jgi:hypothetical protein
MIAIFVYRWKKAALDPGSMYAIHGKPLRSGRCFLIIYTKIRIEGQNKKSERKNLSLLFDYRPSWQVLLVIRS